MNFGQILQQLILGPIELLLDTIYAVALRMLGSPGWSIVVLSLCVNLLLLPLYKRADLLQKEERDRALRMKPRIDQIREVFTGSERFMILQTYYRQNQYKPYYALKGSVSLLLQIPFFMAAYGFLSGLQVLRGVAFGPIRDLGAPDGILQIGGTAVNLLPILMTAINLLSGMLYSRGMPLKSKIQMYGLALVFLVLLYRSPAGLVFYWTLNNVFSLGKNALGRLLHPKVPRKPKEKTPQLSPAQCRGIFLAACVFLALLTGLLIPSAVIKSSTAEFVNVRNLLNPTRYLFSSSLLAAGTFLIWCNVYYHLSAPKRRQTFALVFGAAAAAGAVNFTAFGNEYGDMSSLMEYARFPSVTAGQALLNAGILLAVIAAVVILIRKLPGLMRAVLAACCAALIALSFVNISAIGTEYEESRKVAASVEKENPEIHLSKTGKNVVVIMLDRAVGPFVPYILNEKPELMAQFDGFTYYPNTLSFGFHTNVGSPPLYGGYEYTPDEMNARTDMLLVEKHNEALKVMPVLFLENGYDVTVMDPSLANYMWIPDLRIYDDYPEIHGYNLKGAFTEFEDETLANQYTDEIRNRNLFCYSLFRIAPQFLQTELYNDGDYNKTDTTARTQADPDNLVGVDTDFLQNYWAMQNLTRMTRIMADPKGCFLMLATEETHDTVPLQEPDYVPKLHVDNSAYEAEHGIRTAPDGSTLDIGSGDEFLQMHYQCNMAAFLQLGRWFDYLRQEGVWDNTRIIIVSDHAYDMGVLGFDLAEKYPDRDLKSSVNGEVWTVTTAYEPVLIMKDFGASGFRTDDSFMTNADTPVLATDGIIENPVNPFTGNPITSDAKDAGELHLIETDWHFTDNNGTAFTDSITITFRNRDIHDIDNWIIED